MLRGKCIAFFVLLTCSLCGCNGDDVYADDEPSARPDGTEEATYLSITVTTRAAAATRAVPTGGETGDGEETGLSRENAVNDLSIFIYNDADGRGLDGDADTPIRYARRFDTPADLASIAAPDSVAADGTDYVIPVPMKNYAPEAGDRVLILANADDYVGVETIGALRESVMRRSCVEGATLTRYHSFTMANAENAGRVVMDGAHDGSRERPYHADITLERMAARIDFIVPDGATVGGISGGGSIAYPVAATAARVHVTHLLPVNVMHGGSYLFKRVTESAPADPNDLAAEPLLLCGRETISTDGLKTPTNYVIEPRTLGKAADDAALATWFGDSRADNIRDNAAAFTETYAVDALLASNGSALLDMTLADGKSGRGFVVTYADENTCHRSLQSAQNITGLALRAVYVPPVVYADYDAATDALTADVATDYRPAAATRTGATFYRYRPATASGEEQALYFSNAEAATAYGTAHPADRATVTEYADGVCYYNLWLRHAMPADGTFSCPMEYAIVRNNIYRVVVAFTGPGESTPQIDDIPSGTLDCRIYVRKWNEITHPEIVF